MIFEMLCSKCRKRTEVMSMLLKPEHRQLRFRCSECENEEIFFDINSLNN